MPNQSEKMNEFLQGFGPKKESSYQRALRSAQEFKSKMEKIKKNIQEEIIIEEQNGIL